MASTWLISFSRKATPLTPARATPQQYPAFHELANPAGKTTTVWPTRRRNWLARAMRAGVISRPGSTSSTGSDAAVTVAGRATR